MTERRQCPICGHSYTLYPGFMGDKDFCPACVVRGSELVGEQRSLSRLIEKIAIEQRQFSARKEEGR